MSPDRMKHMLTVVKINKNYIKIWKLSKRSHFFLNLRRIRNGFLYVIWTQRTSSLVQNRKKNCPCDHIPFNLNVDGNLFLRMHSQYYVPQVVINSRYNPSKLTYFHRYFDKETSRYHFKIRVAACKNCDVNER